MGEGYEARAPEDAERVQFDGPKEPERRPVWTALDELGKATSRLDDTADRLVNRLSPAISPRVETARPDGELRQAPGTELEARVRDILERVEVIDRRLREADEDLGL